MVFPLFSSEAMRCLEKGALQFICMLDWGDEVNSSSDDDLTDMGRLDTEVSLLWDSMGKGFIVHPSKSANESDPGRIKALQFLHKIRMGLN